MKIIFKFLLLFFAFSLQAQIIYAQSLDVGIGFLPNKVKAGGKTLFAIDFRYINTNVGGPAITLQSPVTITLPAGVTVVSGGARGYNLASGVWGTTPTVTTTSNSITVAAGASISDANDSTRGTNGYIWVEVQVNNAAIVNRAANTITFQTSTGISYTNATADSATVSIAYTANPDISTTACQPLNIGILLDNSGSMDIPERQDIVDGIKGMLDDLQAFYASGNITTPYQVSISRFAAGATAYEQLISLTDVTSANRASIDAALDGYLNYVNVSTNWIAGLSGMTLTNLDLLFFFTDGTPNNPYEPTLASNNSNDFVRDIMGSYDAATAIKNAGVHLFTITNNDQTYFTSSMDETPATPFGAYLTRTAITGEDSQVYTNDFRTQDYFTGSFSDIKTFFQTSANTICTTIPSTTVSGFVFNDINGNLLVETGELFMDDIPPGYLYVYLINASGIVVDNASVQPNGSYALTANQNQNYTIELSTSVYPLGTNVNVTPINNTPPSGFVTVGENGNNNTGSGDGDPNGVLPVSVGTTPITNQNFAIQEAPLIEAFDDSSTVCVNGLTGGNTNFNVLTNDQVFGGPINPPGRVVITSTPTAYLTVNSNGTVTVAPNTPNGTYTIDYTICFGIGKQALDNDNLKAKGPNADFEMADDCDSATVTVCVLRPNNNPETNPVTHTLPNAPAGDICLDGLDAPLMNGNDIEDGTYTGNTGTVNDPTGIIITSLPTHGELWYYGFGVPIIIAESDILNSTIFEDPSLFCISFTGSGFSSDTFQYSYVDSTGAVDSTPANYTINWINTINAVNDIASVPVNGTTGGNTGINVYGNDTLNGNPTTSANVTLTSTPTPQLSINPTTGAVTVTPNTPAGTYSIVYTICDRANTSLCATARVIVTVVNDPCEITASNPDTDGDGISDYCDLDDDNDGVLDTVECSNTINDLITQYSGGHLRTIAPSDFGLALGARNQNVTADVSHKFGLAANSGAVLITLTNASVHSSVDTWWTKDGELPSVWTVSGSMSAFVIMSQNDQYYGQDSKTIHIYDNATVIPITVPGLANQTDVAGQWSTFESATEKRLTSLKPEDTNISAVVSGNWRYANMNFGPKVFGFSTTTKFADPTYEVSMYLECDTDSDGIPNRIDLNSDNDTCSDANEYYDSSTADGGDNGVYGAGIPAVNANGQVTAASYTGNYANAINASVSTACIVIVAANDTAATPVIGTTGGDAGINVYGNDTLNGSPTTSANVTLTSTPTPQLSINPTTGAVTVTPNTPAGTYTITYRICDVNNTTICSTATVTVEVVDAPEITCNGLIEGTGSVGQSINSNGNFADTFNTVLLGNGSLLGGERDLAITNKAGALPYNLVVGVDNSSVDASYGGGDRSLITVQYDGVDGNAQVLNPTGLGGIDISNMTGFSFGLSKDSNPIRVTVELWSNAGAASSLTRDYTGVYTNQTTYLNFNDFIPLAGAGADLSDIGAVVFKYDTTPYNGSPDFSINNIIFACNNEIEANDDAGTTVSSATGGTAFTNVLVNDTINGVLVIPSQVTTTFVSSTHAGVTLSGTNVVVAPGTPAGNYTLTYQICEVANLANCDTATVTVTVNVPLQPFVCDEYVYQVADNGGNSALYQYDMSTGTRTHVAGFTTRFNAIGYQSSQNLIVGYDLNNHNVVRIGATGSFESYNIPNLPNNTFNVGTVINSDYLFLYLTAAARYYVVDINPSSSSYMQLVDPTNSYAVETSDFGTTISTAIRVSDIAYNATSGNLVGLIDPAVTNQYRIVTLNPVTGTANISATQVSGAGIQGETSAYGSQFTDLNANFLYVFTNTQGRFYRVNLTTFEASLLSNSISASSNDGANCSSVNFNTPIDAVNDTASTPINGATGGDAGINVYANDTLGTVGATPSNVTLTSTPTAQLSIDPATGAVTVAPGTLAGTYTINYTVCETANMSNCDTATVTVEVISLSADIVTVKTDNQTTYTPGSTVAYTITVTNNGPSDAQAVNVVDNAPAGTTITSWSASNGANGTGNLNDTIATLANGQTVTYTVNLNVPSSFTGNLTNAVTVTSPTPDPDPTCTTCTDTDSPNPSADLSITKVASNTTPNVGDNVTFTITATNNGPSDATDVNVTENIPSGYTVVSVTPSVGTWTSPNWSIGNLANGTSATLTVVATVNPTGTYANTVTITGNETDPTPGNNTDTETPTPVAAADLSISKIVNNTTPHVGDTVTFTITATNNGPSAATGVSVTETIPSGYTVVSVTPSSGTWTSPNWVIGNLANGASATLTVVATVNPTGTYANTVTITGNQTDPTPGNNTDTETPTICKTSTGQIPLNGTIITN